MQIGDLSIDTTSYSVKRGDTPIKLSSKEYSLLEYLCSTRGRIVTKDMIISHVWDEDADILPNTVEVYVGYLRNKIDRAFPRAKPLLHTVRGFGYKLEPEA
jgi:DNA-binding response OmpR family regulator